MRVRRRALALTAATALVVALGAGCAHHDGASPKTTPDAASATAPSGGPSRLAEMQKKVNAAESAAAAADRDAAGTADR
ncbi:hypothetical protein [Streptomyces sp. NPDC001135]